MWTSSWRCYVATVLMSCLLLQSTTQSLSPQFVRLINNYAVQRRRRRRRAIGAQQHHTLGCGRGPHNYFLCQCSPVSQHCSARSLHTLSARNCLRSSDSVLGPASQHDRPVPSSPRRTNGTRGRRAGWRSESNSAERR